MMKLLAIGGALGALLAFFLDPQAGRRRRIETRDRVLATFRRAGRKTARAGRGVAAEAYGVAQKAQHLREEPKEYDDATLAHKVETEIFRDVEIPKGQININAQEGVIQLRGELPNEEMIEDLVSRVRDVQGVRDVENLLHLPGQPAPMHT
jgi:osmotically-inducible protein OsmY